MYCDEQISAVVVVEAKGLEVTQMRAPMAGRPVGWRPSRSRAPLAVVDDTPADRPAADTGSFEHLVAEHHAQHRAHLHRVAVRLSGDSDTANDLVQEAFYRALIKFDQFRQGTDVKTWLVRIVTNCFLDRWKHQRVERKAEPELSTAGDAARETADAPIDEIPDATLYAAIQALEPDLRAVVELCYLKEMRYRDAAEQLKVPVSTIGTRLMRARAYLRDLLTNPDAVKP
jgi:RNA polymerase sigma-70 factor (ECF subfamily)